MEMPEALRALNSRPGADWTEVECAAVERWWAESGPERLVWHCAARYIGAGGVAQDVEDAWLDFYKLVLPRARLSYRPDGPDFVTYALNICLKRHCILLGARIRRRTEREEPLEDGHGMESTGSTGPGRHAEEQAFREALDRALNDPEIPETHRTAFRLRHLAGLSYRRIAEKMEAPEGSVKVWAHRAAARLARRLRQEGWLD